MSGPARAGALIYARHLEALSSFYQNLLAMQPLAQDADLRRGQKVVRRGRLRLANAKTVAVSAAATRSDRVVEGDGARLADSYGEGT